MLLARLAETEAELATARSLMGNVDLAQLHTELGTLRAIKSSHEARIEELTASEVSVAKVGRSLDDERDPCRS